MPEQAMDKELEQFRNLMHPPSTFEDGFSWMSLIGAIFVSLIMVPGAMYMSLLAGGGAGRGIGPAAQWVTVILFLEMARRAQRHLKRAEIYILFFMAGSIMSTPFQGLIWRQFFVSSDAAAAHGVAEWLPSWFAPNADQAPDSYANRSFFYLAWLPAIGLTFFRMFFGQLANMVLGYGLFRLTSDVEKLPFPMAPVSAQGIMALAEDIDEKKAEKDEQSWRWRTFSIGGAIGLAFGALYLGLPTITGALTGKPIMIFPIPFYDSTPKTEELIPAFATGFSWDLGNFIFGMVLPFGAVVGTLVGLIITGVLNPILYHFEILNSWQRGDSMQTTLFKNNVDFYFSFAIGVALAVAVIGLYQMYKQVKRKRAELKDKPVRGDESSAEPLSKRGRGDIPSWTVVTVYVLVTMAYILASGYLINWDWRVMLVLIFLGFIYTPLISYVTARLEGIAGQVVEIPMVREASLILSGYKGVDIWFLPIPIANYGRMTVFYRVCELTGTKFTSVWKANIILYPVILTSSILFANFIWGLAEVPSAVYPFAQKMWELNANNECIMFSSTLPGGYSIFEDAFRWSYLGWGVGSGIALFLAMNYLGAPIFIVYGVVRGLGQTFPANVIPQFLGALIGKYYFQRKMGLKWRQYIPVVSAGFACGQGLITVFGVGVTFISKAVVQLPF
jgi:hypothetical protein